jgi:type IX secretion system PorP/SprF family membrane protein
MGWANRSPGNHIVQYQRAGKTLRKSVGDWATIRSDKAGFDNDIGISLAYSYFIDIGQGSLGIGLTAGMINKALDPTWVIPSGDIYVPPSGDPLIPENKESYVAFDAGLGVFYSTGKYYAGISVTHINEPKIKFSKGTPYLSRHYYLTAGYNLTMPNPAFEFKPSILAFSDGRVMQLTLSSVVTYNKKVWGGVSYRAGDALIGMAGVELYNGIRLGYAYDFSMTDIRRNTSGSHEFMINYCFEISLGRSPMKYKSVRFL